MCFLFHQIATKRKTNKNTRCFHSTREKSLPLGEENPHIILLTEIPIDEYKDHDP